MSGEKKPDNWRIGSIKIEFKGEERDGVHDVCLIVGKEGSKKIFWAHKHILVPRCSAFQTMYFERYTGKIIPIPDDDSEAFGMLLRFLYDEALHFASVSEACKTYSLGINYSLPDLQRVVVNYIHAVPMNDKTFLNIVQNDLFFNATVKDRCFKYICEKTEELVNSDSFLKMPEYIVDFILHREDISVGEFTLLMAVTRWCYNRYAGEIDFKDILLKYLGQIRYLDVTTSEFNEFIEHFPDAMDLESYSAIVKYISKSSYNLPSWCTETGHRLTLRNLNN